MLRMFTTLLRARKAEVEEAVFDANAIALLRQHLRDATAGFEIAKHELAHVLASETSEARAAAGLGERIGALETEARAALAAADGSRAEALAGRIAVLEDERAAHLDTAAMCGREAGRIRAQVDVAARRIAEVRRGLASASAVEALQRTRGRLGEGGQGSLAALREAEETLRRIKDRQQGEEDVSAAMTKLEGELPIAGPGAGLGAAPARRQTDPKDVLERLKR